MSSSSDTKHKGRKRFYKFTWTDFREIQRKIFIPCILNFYQEEDTYNDDDDDDDDDELFLWYG